MITGGEILKDLENIKKKIEFAQIIYSNNSIWPEVNKKLNNVIDVLKSDMKIFGYE